MSFPDFLVEKLRALPFVRWDRFIGEIAPGQHLDIYGWIDRDDGRADFVLLQLYPHGTYYVTSSSRYSREIGIALGAFDDNRGHEDCERVEHFVPEDLPNVVRLS